MSQGPVLLSLKVSAKASRNAVTGWLGDALKISVTAAPERGKANQAVIETLAQALDIARTRIEIVAGHTQAQKRVAVTGLSEDELRARLR